MESVDAILNTGFIWDDILKMGKLSLHLYLPEVKFNEEDFVHIENLEGIGILLFIIINRSNENIQNNFKIKKEIE